MQTNSAGLNQTVTQGFRVQSKSENKVNGKKPTVDSMNNINPSTRKYLEQIEKAHTKRTESSGAHFSDALTSDMGIAKGQRIFESQPATIN